MRLLLDQGIPRDARALFRKHQADCLHVGELGMSAATDQEILAVARDLKAVIVTLDADFHAMLAVAGAGAPSVIRLRLQGLNAAAVFETVRRAISTFEIALERGSLVTVKSNKMTCRLLPVGHPAEAKS